MAYTKNNINGIQKIPETQVLGKEEMGASALSGGMTGLAMGMKTGNPIIAAGGAVVGAGVSLAMSSNKRQQQQEQLRQDQGYNKWADHMNSRPIANQRYQPVQAYHGVTNTGDAIPVDVHKNEYQLDKDGNIKNIFSFAPTDPNDTSREKQTIVLGEGEKIVPAAKRKLFDRLHKKVVLGDKSAKKQLKSLTDSFPTEKEAMAQQSIDTKSEGTFQPNINIPTPEDAGVMADLTPQRDVAAKPLGTQYETNTTHDNVYDYRTDGLNNVQTKKKVATDWIDPEGTPKAAVQEVMGVTDTYKNPLDTQADNLDNLALQKAGLQPMDNNFDNILKKYAPETNGDMNNADASSIDKNIPNAPVSGTVAATTDNINPDAFETFNNIGNYANIAYNLKKGSEMPDRATRRYNTPETVQYKDMSAQARSDVRANRNAVMENMRGKGLSAGQASAYNRQAGAQANRQMGQIASQENQRAYQTDVMNTQIRNQSNQQNTQMAQQYDMYDQQAKAAQEAFTAAAFQEGSKRANIYDQQRYAKQRDEKAYKTQQDTLKYIGANNIKFRHDKDGNIEQYYSK